MPNRIIKESICTSDTIDLLSWFEEVCFYRLIVNCDDYGRLDARPAILKSKLFPLKTITDKQMESAINRLRTVGMIEVYKYDDRPYLQLRTWDRHQTIRAKKSKYPSLQASEIICKQMQADESKCSRNPIQSESNPNPNPNPNPTALARMFGEFWTSYPKKVGKPKVEQKFNKLNPNEELFTTMMQALEAQKKSAQWQKENGQYIPNPETWINQRRWEDELTPSPTTRQGSEYDGLIL